MHQNDEKPPTGLANTFERTTPQTEAVISAQRYHVTLEKLGETHEPYEGSRSWGSCDDQQAFEAFYNGTMKDGTPVSTVYKIIAQGVTAERAEELCLEERLLKNLHPAAVQRALGL